VTDKQCLCVGIRLARNIVEYTDNPALPGGLQSAQAIYDHLLLQANKPHNLKVKQELTKDFEDMRTELMKDKGALHPGVLSLNVIRDKIHKSPELKSLLICGESFSDKQERDNVLKILEKTWEIMAESDDTSEAYGPLDDLAKHYGCDSLTQKKYSSIGQCPISWFHEVGKQDIQMVGGKGANLGEMTQQGISVPPGFIVTTNAYYEFLEHSGLKDKIRDLLKPLDANNSKQLQEVSDKIKELIITAPLQPELAESIREAYNKMGKGMVAVRSSATAEDLPEFSFAGQQATFLNISGENEVVEAVKACMASLFEARSIFYREKNKFDHFKVGIAVPVQRMVQSKISGVMFTADPSTGDKNKIIIDAVYGLGETLVSGDVTPDHYEVSKENMEVTDKEIKNQEWKLIKGAGNTNVKVPLTSSEQSQQKISDEDLLSIANTGKILEQCYGTPQDVEWAKDEQGNIYIVQTRPITTMLKKKAVPIEINATPILIGSPASPGRASGPTNIVIDTSDLDAVKEGDVLVTEFSTPDFVPAMRRASAVVTDRGGRTSHAAIICREFNLPCVVGTGKATKTLKQDQVITVDGFFGKVYKGKLV
jgi:pyruvate,water dikinase